MTRAAIHASAGVVFLGMAVLLSYPLILHLGTHVPGANSSEDLKFLWNFWWFRTPGVWSHPFDSSAVFAPFGISLVLDTHTALPAVVGATLLRSFDVVPAMNLVLLAGLTLNGWVTYALAYRLFGRALPAVLAGAIFGSSAFVSIHFLGHFNLVHAWTLPLVVLACDRLFSRPSWPRGVAAGVALAITTYTDYYYALYSVGLSIGWLLACRYALDVRLGHRTPRKTTLLVIGGLATLVLLLIVTIAITGGFEFRILGRLVNLHDTRNLKTLLWILATTAVLSRWRLRGEVARRLDAPPAMSLSGPVLAAIGVYAVLLIPLATAAWRMAASGGFVAAPIHWLSSEGGVDAATFVLGHPLHSWYWKSVQQVYSAFRIGLIEQTGWIGLVPIALLIVALRRVQIRWWTSPWTAIGLVALIWSLGPFLTVAGWDTGLVLPQAFLRYVPVLSNARMPGRAFVLVQLAVAMACAAAVTRLNIRSGTIATLVALVLLDSLTLPISLDAVRPPQSVERTLSNLALPAGAVLELPVGVSDGFGEIGKLDFRMLSSQMRHGRALVGGFAGRVPGRIKDAYLSDPVVGPLFRLSAQESQPSAALDVPPDASAHLMAMGIRYLIVNRDAAPPALVAAATRHIRMRLLASDGPRELYALDTELPR